MVESTALEMRRTGNRTVGSNPTLSAKVARLPLASQKRPNSRQPFELPLQFTVRSLLHFVATRRKMMAATKTGGAKRGFAAMDPAKQREIASKGGKASHGGGRRSASSSR